MFSSAGVSATFQEEIKHPPEEQQTFVESRLFIGDEAIALGSCALNEIVLRFWDFFCAAGLQLRVHENTSLVVSGCLRLLSGAPDALIHPIRSIPQFRWLL